MTSARADPSLNDFRGSIVQLGETSVVEWMPQGSEAALRPRLDAARVHLHLVASGVFTWTGAAAAGRESWSLQQGQAFFTHGDADLIVDMPGVSRLITVSVPRDALPERVMDAGAGLTRVRTDSGLLAPIYGFVSQVRRIETTELSGVARYYVERLLHEMVVALSVDLDRLGDVPRGSDVFSRALALIAAQCTDRDLSASSLARDVSLSLRQLERTFSERGTTIGAVVRRTRVEHAISLLRREDYDALSIDQVAAYSGFANGSSLARAMRAEGHPSPARVRSDRVIG